MQVGIIKPTYNKIWQNRYWEHTIRNEEDLNKHQDYIHYNPVKHKLVKSVKIWEYSSFNKFVEQKLYDKNFGSSKDIENIKIFDFE